MIFLVFLVFPHSPQLAANLNINFSPVPAKFLLLLTVVGILFFRSVEKESMKENLKSSKMELAARNGQEDGGDKEKPVVCFLGPVSSYTHQATLSMFPKGKFELMPVVTIKDIFDTTQAGHATYGIVPFENSTNGSVVFTLDHFADRQSVYGDLSVCAEIYLDVHHCFLGHLPLNASLAHIKHIYSHPQAFGQCTKFLTTHLHGIETIDVSSTSRAAELVKADKSGESAAISSAMAADLTGLHVLARDIEDREDNTTRFFVLRRGLTSEGSCIPGIIETRKSRGGDEKGNEGKGLSLLSRTKSLVSFTVPHRSPGALADVLECFRRGGLNLTSINSRPSLNEPFQYVFFVEFEGHKFQDPDGRVKGVLESVGKVAQSWRWLGSWESMRV